MNPSSPTFDLLDYQEVLKRIQGNENHLLPGNGFNRGLGVNTSYSSIFQKMVETLYITTLDKYKEQAIEKAVRKFPAKSIHLFDAITIFYELPVAVDTQQNKRLKEVSNGQS